MSTLRLGTSGWSYKEWEKVFYPAGEKAKLPFYARYFDTVEIDSTFYAYPSRAIVASWVRNSPDGFVFSAKLPKLITHEKKLDVTKGTEKDLVKFLSVMKPLRDQGKLGPVLIQLPPSFRFEDDMERLAGFLEILPQHVRFAIEFRDSSWLRAETWDLLRSFKVANTVVDEPLLPSDAVVTTDFSFVRWHGQGTRPWYNYRYDKKELTPWKDKLEDLKTKTKTTFGYFNNHFHGNAVENALEMMKIVGQANKEQLKAGELITRRLDAVKAGRADPDQERL